MSETANLRLPFLAAGQAQKHVTLNEIVLALDHLVQAGVSRPSNPAPPASPVAGARFIVPAGATGAWSGHAQHIAVWQDGAWDFHLPNEGWVFWSSDDGALVVFAAGAWRVASASSGTPLWGVNTAADATNRLSVRAQASLFSHEGQDHRLKINKASSADTASLLFQSNFTGTAEIGLTGSDDLRIKTATSGGIWNDALVFDRNSGCVILPLSPAGAGESLIINGEFTLNQRGFAGGALAAGAFGFDRWKAGASGATLSVDASFLATLSAGSLVQVIESTFWQRSGFAGQTLCVSAEDVAGDLIVSIAGVSATLQSGTGRRGATLTLPSGATGNLSLSLAPSGASSAFRRFKLERGPLTTLWQPRSAFVETALCQRYFAKSHALATAPSNGALGSSMIGAVRASNFVQAPWLRLPVAMRATPSIAFLAGSVGTPVAGQWALLNGATWSYGSGITTIGATESGFAAEMTLAGLTIGASHALVGGWTASAEL